MTSRTRWIIVVLVAVLAVGMAGGLAIWVTGSSGPRTAPSSPGASGETPGGSAAPTAPGAPSTSAPVLTDAEAAGRDFLDRYVDPDGRVVRRDQGGDTVSEGQAYALLIAVAVGDRERFDAVWSWTRDTLARESDGLLSWRWSEGAVVDAESASDADLDAARALVLAAETFDEPAYRTAGITLGQAILDHETVTTTDGRILVAGTWARQAPYAYNPSYASPAATAVLAAVDPDPRWAELDRGSTAVTARVLDGTDLPPDWGQVRADGGFEPMPGAAGRGNDGVRYGYDATRMPIRFAESCTVADVELAASTVPALDRFDGIPAARDLGGQPLAEVGSPVAAAGQAAAHAAAGDTGTAAAELEEMAVLEQLSPTYYGSAWNALSRFLLTTDVLGGCPPIRA